MGSSAVANPLRMQERIRCSLQVGSCDQSAATTTLHRPADGGDVPPKARVLLRSLSSASSNLFHVQNESSSTPEDCSDQIDNRSVDEEAGTAADLKEAKSLLEMYKKRSGDLVHANEDLRNQLMALQIENTTLKIENDKLKCQNEAFIQSMQKPNGLNCSSDPARQELQIASEI